MPYWTTHERVPSELTTVVPEHVRTGAGVVVMGVVETGRGAKVVFEIGDKVWPLASVTVKMGVPVGLTPV